ncbi:hypothetical protein C8R42DRAFT_644544 [Lentinula raphanica]|nr:hypothetical protein C8R42DRAFT_644544 [Lentinula raphanica]
MEHGILPQITLQKRKNAIEHYHVSDPFINDFEVAVGNRKFLRPWFYVSSGEVAMKDRHQNLENTVTPKPRLHPKLPESLSHEGSSIALNNNDDDASTGQIQIQFMTKETTVKDMRGYGEGGEQITDEERGRLNLVAAETWEQKSPMKGLLVRVAFHATLDQYDDHFLNLIPRLFLYDKSKITKLIKRTLFVDHVKLLVDRQDSLMTDLKREAHEGVQKAEEEWEKSVVHSLNRSIFNRDNISQKVCKPLMCVENIDSEVKG